MPNIRASEVDVGSLKHAVEVEESFVMGDKPEILVDENTRQFISDPNHLFNLTLSTFPKSMTIYLGRLTVANEHNVARVADKTSSIAKHPKYVETQQGSLAKNQSIDRSVRNLRNKQLFYESS